MTALKDYKKPKPNKSSKINAYARFSGIAFQMIVIIVLGTYVGVKLDETYPNKHSLYTVVSSLLSVGIAMYFVIRKVSQNKK